MSNFIQTGAAVVSLTASTTLGYLVGQTAPPNDLVVISAAAGTTLTLPILTMAQTGIGLGFGSNQLRILNLAAQPVTLAADGSATFLGAAATVTVAQNVACTLESNANANVWYRLNG